METSFLANIHPKVVHFPVALLTTYSLLEITGILFTKELISKSALLILILAVVSAFIAVLTGNEAASGFSYWTDESKVLLNEHRRYATYLVWFSALVCGLRIFVTLKKKFTGFKKYIFILFTLVMIYLVYQTGHYGAELVVKHGVGTEIRSLSEPE
jgi:uncharacterized membrane protein